jgi:hypothetical protein
MSYIIVDIESDGPYPLDFSMVNFGAVVVEPSLAKTFYGKTRPISEKWIPEALAISGISRDEHLTFPDPQITMKEFIAWVDSVSIGKPIFVSDNLAYDWMWICTYCHKFAGRNPFGYSGRRIGDLYAGMMKDVYVQWKHLRTTEHTHNPVDDAKGNAEALLAMKEMGLKIDLK